MLSLLSAMAVALLAKEGLAAGQQECVDIHTEVNFKMDDLEGNWYPMEIVLHRNDSKIYGVPTDTNCPVVLINSGSRGKKVIHMIWNATEGIMEYKFTQKGVKGQWQATGEQSGSLVNDEYRHYGGVVQLLYLRGDYMFMTFCSSKYRLLSTVAFSRSENLPEDVFEETLGKLDAKHYKRTKTIHTRPCRGEEEEEEGGSSHRILSSCLLYILPSLVVRFGH